MAHIESSDTSNAISSMQALRSALTEDLDDIESRMQALLESNPEKADDKEDMEIFLVARAALYSALASINEVLGWVHLMAEKDSEGNVPEAVRSLPTVAMFSIH